MATFFMFGKYTTESIQKISAERTQQAVNEIKKMAAKSTPCMCCSANTTS